MLKIQKQFPNYTLEEEELEVARRFVEIVGEISNTVLVNDHRSFIECIQNNIIDYRNKVDFLENKLKELPYAMS